MIKSLSWNENLDFEELSRTICSKKNIRRTAEVVRIGLFSILFLLLAFSVWLVFITLFATSPSLDRLTQTVQRGQTTIQELTSESAAPRDSFSRKDARIIRDTRLFGTKQETDTGTPQAEEPTAEPVAPLNLNLIGTFVSPGDEDSVAILEDKKLNEQEVFSPGADVFGQGILKQIYANRVEILRNGKTETLQIDDSAPEGGGDGAVAPANSEEIVVEEDELNTALENLPLLLTQARAVPYFKQGKAVGLRLFAIKSGSLYEKIGLKNGDILKTINGNNLGDFSQAMKLFEQLKEERSLNLVLERNREEKVFHYSIQ